ncbi:MAG: SpoIVB peptidase S55 domain-containing protein [bacterium]|nr:SpoIVB peptidase S55 domain-containing protein [bacterium]
MMFLLLFLLGTDFMVVDDVKPGMTGYGLTVFQGTKIDTFQVKIIAVMKKEVIKGDVILAEISGGIIDTAGIISGMSGSPVYIDGKLVGALAYSYGAFAKKPLAGITPIDEMLNPPSIGWMAPKGRFCQMQVPFYCYGLDDEILHELSESIPCFNIFRVQDLGSGLLNDSILPSPGSSLGIPLVVGDINWFAVGTCTYKDGDKILGFGHPMASLGETELPMTAGYIYSIVPSSYNSYKLGASTKIIGTIKNDNQRGIVGVIGKIPDMVEFSLFINGKRFHYHIVKERTFIPHLLHGLVLYSIYTGFKGSGDMTISANLEVNGTHSFHFENLYTGTAQAISKSIFEIFEFIQNNPFHKIDVANISLNLTTSERIKLAKIDKFWSDKTQVKTGDTLNLLLSLSTYQEGLHTERISIPIPRWAQPGELIVKVESGSSVCSNERANLTTLDGLIVWLSRAPKNNELVLRLSQKGKSSWIMGRKFTSLPPSMAPIGKDKESMSEVFEKRIATQWVIVGEGLIKLNVK